MNRYEVLLQRENGINKTVYVDDCYYEDEARLLAESQYGLPVLRVLFQGQSNSGQYQHCLLYTSPSPRDGLLSRMPSSA